MVLLLGKTIVWFINKLDTELSYGPSIPFLVVYPTELKTECSDENLYVSVNSSTTHNNQKVETA